MSVSINWKEGDPPAPNLYFGGPKLIDFPMPVEKFNPNHYPKGAERAGQFAPKDSVMDVASVWPDKGNPLVRVSGIGSWGGSHYESQMITGEAAAMMGIPGYRRDDIEENARSRQRLANAFLQAIETSPGSPHELTHGFTNVNGTEWHVGDTIRIPLMATSGDVPGDSAGGYGLRTDPENRRNALTAFVLPAGTPMAGYARWARGDAVDFGHIWSEAIVGGGFRITGVGRTKTLGWRREPVTVVHLEQTEIFDPATRTWRPR